MKQEDILKGDLPIVIAKLLSLKENGKEVVTGNMSFKIRTISFLGRNFNRIHIPNKLSLDDSMAVAKFIKSIGYPIVSKNLRWNIEVNGNRVQIRSMSDNTRALINHTNRAKFSIICEKAGVSIKVLDDIISKYWELRTLGIIKEDVHMDDENCPFRSNRKELEKLFTWIAFHSLTDVKGITNGNNGCDYILDYRDPKDISTWNVFGKRDYIKVIYNNLVFSLRDTKGMPQKYTPYSNKFSPLIKPWVRYRNEKYKGALHIRIKNLNTADSKVKYYIDKYKQQIEEIKSNNKGERDEILVKIYLIRCRMSGTKINLNGQDVFVSTLGNTPKDNYLNFTDEVEEETNWNSISQSATILFALCQMAHVEKAPSTYKADLYINGIGISIKSGRAAAPSIINTTARSGMINAIDTINHLYSKAFGNLTILPLDQMVNDYWNKRLNGIISEDIHITDNNCPFVTYKSKEVSKEYFKPIITYFCFDGTGKGKSPYTAQLILVCMNPEDCNTWTYYDRETYFEYVWNKLVFSIRSQRSGDALSKKKNLPWVKHLSIKGDEKVYGLLNVRVSNK